MFFTQGPAWDKELALWQAMGEISYHGTVLSTDPLEANGLSRQAGKVRYLPNVHKCGYLLRQSSEETVVLLQGATVANGEALALSAMTEETGPSFLHAIPAVFRAAKFIFDSVLEVGNWRDNVTICGHSYGGAVGIVLGLLLRRGGLDSQHLRIMTVGSPRPMTLEGWRYADGLNLVRYMAERDVVPYVMPWAVESPRLHSLVSRAQSRRIDQYTQGGLGICFFDDGTRQRLVYPPWVPGDTGYRMVSWLTENITAGNPTHSWQRYLPLFLLRSQNAPVTVSPTETAPGGTPPITPHYRTVQDQRAIDAARREYVTLGVSQVRSRRVMEKGHLLTKVKSADIWSVNWQGRVIASFQRRSDAARLVRDGNGFLRRLHRAMEVDGYTMAESLSDFLEAVQEKDGPANPPYRVTGLPHLVSRA